MASDESEEFDETCIFCLIAKNQDEETEVIKQNEELVCFRDICPAAPHHYLVIPREHIHSCRSLSREHIHLVERMTSMGKAVLKEQGITSMKEVRLGFHQPPFISVGHLHLHVIAPVQQISTCFEYKFIPETDSFVTVESLRRKLLKTAPPATISCSFGKCFGLS